MSNGIARREHDPDPILELGAGELILALDLFFRLALAELWSKEPAVAELSETLRSMPLFPVEQRPANVRNPTAVYFKLLNFWYIATNGAAGLSNYGAADKQVWDDFCRDQDRLHAAAVSIRQGTGEPAAAVPDEGPDDGEAPEGRILLRLHRARERSPALVRERKRRALQHHGALRCEVCGFDYKAVYGDLGDSFIECHHTVPVSQLAPGQKTKLSDLALVCANCHHMLHRGGEVSTLQTLRDLIKATAVQVHHADD